MLRIILVTAVCCAVVIGLAYINIFLGLLSVPIMRDMQKDFMDPPQT